MKNFKITALFTVLTLLAVSIFITSCQQDSLLSTESNDLSIEDRDKGVGVNLFGPAPIYYPKFRHNGQWFEFADKKSYDQGLNSLTAYANDPKNNTGEIIIGGVKDGDFSYDSNPALANFEMHYGHQSLRKEVELEEDERLRSGEDPARFQSDLDDRGFTFDVEASLLNKDGVVKIGRDIFIAYDKSTLIKVDGRRPDIVKEIIADGAKAAFDIKNSTDVKIINVGPSATCTADFTATEGNVDNTANTATYAFVWNNGNASNVTNLFLQWDFGDGTTMSSINPGIGHTYTNLQPFPATNTFTVILTATYEIGGKICSETSTEEVNIALESTGSTLDECDYVSITMATVQTLGLNPFINVNVTPGNPQQVCINTTGIVNLGSSLLDLTWRWNFQGQTSSDVSPCFNTPCDSDYSITLELLDSDGTVCGTFTGNYDHNTDANCQGHSDFNRDDDFTFMDGGKEYKACVKGKHRTRRDFDIFGKNRIEGKMKTYKRKSGGGWKKTKKDHEIYIEGNVYPHGNGCACGGSPGYVQEQEIDNNTKTSCLNHELFSNTSEGIYCRVDDPYTIRFVVDGGVLDESLSFPQ